jgi:non-ribosomal peptide synthetase component F
LPGVCSSWSTLADDLNRFNSYALMLQCSPHEPVGGKSTISVETSYDSGILNTRQIQRIIQQFGYIIDGLLSSDGSTVMGAIEFISPEDKKELAIWNNPERLHTVDACLHEMFEKQVVLAPDLAAVSSWDGQLTYGELNELANQLCSILRSRGVIRSSPVALCFEHSKWMTVASMATLKAGGTLIALDHKHPVNRLEHILSSTNVKFLLTSRSCSTLLRTAPMTIVVDSTNLDEMTPTDLSWPSDLSSPSDIAVVVFISGTTDMPKGYHLEHKAICSNAVAFGTGMFINSQTRVFQVSPFYDYFGFLLLESSLPVSCLGGYFLF